MARIVGKLQRDGTTCDVRCEIRSLDYQGRSMYCNCHVDIVGAGGHVPDTACANTRVHRAHEAILDQCAARESGSVNPISARNGFAHK
jgi:hypothetical protein